MVHARLLLLLTIAVAATAVLADREPTSPLPAPPPLEVPGATAATADPPPQTLDAIAHCESRGDPTAVSADGVYRGKYQFNLVTWQSIGGSGDPAQASEHEQDHRARALAAERGTAPWPVCRSARAGS